MTPCLCPSCARAAAAAAAAVRARARARVDSHCRLFPSPRHHTAQPDLRTRREAGRARCCLPASLERRSELCKRVETGMAGWMAGRGARERSLTAGRDCMPLAVGEVGGVRRDFFICLSRRSRGVFPRACVLVSCAIAPRASLLPGHLPREGGRAGGRRGNPTGARGARAGRLPMQVRARSARPRRREPVGLSRLARPAVCTLAPVSVGGAATHVTPAPAIRLLPPRRGHAFARSTCVACACAPHPTPSRIGCHPLSIISSDCAHSPEEVSVCAR